MTSRKIRALTSSRIPQSDAISFAKAYNCHSKQQTMDLLPTQSSTGSLQNPFEPLYREICELKQLMYTVINHLEKNNDDLMNVEEASRFTRLKKETIYNMTSTGKIPFIKRPDSRKLLFSRSALESWVNKGQALKVIPIEDQLLKLKSSA